MDLSQEYINTCREASELQDEGRYWTPGDFYAEQIGEWHISMFIGYEYYSKATDGRPMKDWVWLPRQDQSMDMCLEGLTPLQKMDIILRYFEEQGIAYYGLFKSMEQLWLAFVMKEKFNKHWNGTTWEVSDESP